MCHENEEWYKIWIGIDLAIQIWHEEFDEFWFEHLKNSKICTLMDCFWTKALKIALKIDTKFEEKLTCTF